MDHFDRLRNDVWIRLVLLAGSLSAITLALYWLLSSRLALGAAPALGISIGVGFLLPAAIMRPFSRYALSPLQALWQAVMHISPTEHGTSAPDMEKLSLGREMVTSLIAQVRQLTTVAEQTAAESRELASDLHRNFIAQNLPLPLVVLDAAENITFANEAAAQYIGIAGEDMIGKNVYMVLDMSFPSADTFDGWLKDVKVNSATAVSSWERVRLNVRDDHPARLFDLAAYYNRDNAQKIETMLVLFDHTQEYSQDEQAVSFIALSVHELRTPLTLLRGYIEVFEEELSGTSDPELKDFMFKMKAMAEQLTAFVNNILNVARVDGDQLELRLQSEDWRGILKSSIEMLGLRARVRGISLQGRVALDLPPVAVDNLSIREVINNLVDNAIKYSGNSKVIKIETFVNKEGLVETTVQDFGVGIPTSIIPNLFTKFYRDHRNRAQIGGTGLGLYLSKAIVTAHGGSISIRSKEGEGTTVGFTLVPYAQLEEAKKHKGEQEITRSAHGWIKNHSLYRR